jgi:hypothetical protein
MEEKKIDSYKKIKKNQKRRELENITITKMNYFPVKR